jgi:mRNA interferase HigB
LQVIHWGRARQFFQKHPQAEAPLRAWRASVQAAAWKNFPDVKKTWNSADWFEGKIIFDIKGNDFRLIAIAKFENKKLYIREILDHTEYDKGLWKREGKALR